MNVGNEDKTRSPVVKPDEVAAYLKVSRNCVLNWAKAGDIPCIRIGKTYRFFWDEIIQNSRIRPDKSLTSNN